MSIIKELFYVAVIFLGMWMAFYLGMRNEPLAEKVSRYDCRLTEFAPDIPPEVRQECRRRHIEQINQQKDQ